MSRAELASYLGLRPETLSRCFRELTQYRYGWITNDNRGVEIRDVEGLRRFADG